MDCMCACTQWVKWKSRYPRSHPAGMISVTMHPPLSSQLDGEAVKHCTEAFSKEIWTSLALSFCEDICQQFRDGREREQIIPQQGITVVPLNSLKLNKQQEARPEAEERLMDMTVSFFPKSSASVFLNSLRLWIPGNCILEQIKK